MKLKLILFLLPALLPFCRNLRANNNQQTPSRNTTITGTLPNGLRYYVQKNPVPQQVAELRLVVNAGSVLEDADQLGLAHMCEHMAFNGTRKFRKNDLVSFLEKNGVQYGHDLNAYTSFTETVFILPLPVRRASDLDKGLEILEEWAHHVTYLPEDIDGERGIVLEENRQTQSAGRRIAQHFLPELLGGTKYGVRLPGGDDSIIQHFSYETLRRFYRDWYRPSLMAVIVVGDIDPARAITMIRNRFSPLSDPVPARQPEYPAIPAFQANNAVILPDPEATHFTLQINYAFHRQPWDAVGYSLKDELLRDVLAEVYKQQLEKLARKENLPLINIDAGYASFARGFESFKLSANGGNTDIGHSINAVLAEIRRLKTEGITAGEWQLVVATLNGRYKRQSDNRFATASSDYASQCMEHYLNRKPMREPAYRYVHVKTILTALRLHDINALLKTTESDKKLLLLAGPLSDADARVPSRAAIVAAMDSSMPEQMAASHGPVAVTKKLLTTLPRPGNVVSVQKNALWGTIHLRLANGVLVTLKPTAFNDNEVVIQSVRPGGKLLFEAKDKYNAEYATDAVEAMGFNGLTASAIKDALAGSSVSVKSYLSSTQEGIKAKASPGDMELLFQAIYLRFMTPTADSLQFRRYVQQNRSQFLMMRANPTLRFIDTVFSALYNNNPSAPLSMPRSSYFTSLDYQRICGIYRERFGDAGRMHFIIAGPFSYDAVLPLVKRYLGSLPATGKQYPITTDTITPPPGKRTMQLNIGRDDKSMIFSFYSGKIHYNENLKLSADLLCKLLDMRIVTELREKMQGVYSGSVVCSITREAGKMAHYMLMLSLPCGPEKTDTLLTTFQKEIAQLAEQGPLPGEWQSAREQLKNANRLLLLKNSEWVGRLADHISTGSDLRYFMEYDHYIDRQTADDIRRVAKDLLLDCNNVFTAVKMPAEYK